jgi:uncharacterized protein YyaL (SSP411 family)
VREERIHPGLDDKVLADWNGLMIAALANAAQVFERPDWLDLARNAFAFITTQMTDTSGRLSHSWRAGRRNHPAILDDYANLCRAALCLYEAAGEPSYLARAESWIAILDQHYWDAVDHGYFLAADDTKGLITRSKTANDAAVPAGNGTMVAVLARLFYLTGDTTYRDRADAIVRTFSGEVTRNFFPLATLINSCALLEGAVQIVIRGRRGAGDTSALVRAVHDVSLPTKILTVIGNDTALPSSHPAAGKDTVAGKATAYVCEGPVCSLPITDPVALAADLRQRR